MINRGELTKIGNFNKPHGIKGEITCIFTSNYFFKRKYPFFIFELKGIFVPFRVESYHFISDSIAFIKLKNIETIEQTSLLSYKEVFFLQKQLTENPKNNFFSWDYVIGFNIIDEKIGEIGYITNIDASTPNILFILKKEGKEIFVPAVKAIIIAIDSKQKTIFMKLPNDLF